MARHVANEVRFTARQAVVVVSAMSGTTGLLLELLHAIDPDPEPQVAAALLTTGETVSAALLTAALCRAGLSAHLVSAAETGFVATGPADRATLAAVDPGPLRRAVSAVDVVVVPGGQAVNADGHVVLMGRNSSDLSAVAAAVAVGAQTCDLFSDVPGVCSADPYVVPDARTLAGIPYATMVQMSHAGAKVVHEAAVTYAERAGVRLRCRTLPPVGRCASVIGDGQPTAAVVVHEHGVVWAFGDATARRSAPDALTAAGIDALPVDTGAPYLVVSAGAHRDLVASLTREGVEMSHLRLLTTIGADGRVCHELHPAESVAAVARRRHDEQYPPGSIGPGAPAPRAGDGAFGRAAKRRSDHSGVLVNDGRAVIDPADWPVTRG